MAEVVALVDYGAGNLHSVHNALKAAGAEVTVTADPYVVRAADRIVLPGVGSFKACAEGLRAIPHMVEAMTERVQVGGAPFLGICVGMQLLATRGAGTWRDAGSGLDRGGGAIDRTFRSRHQGTPHGLERRRGASPCPDAPGCRGGRGLFPPLLSFRRNQGRGSRPRMTDHGEGLVAAVARDNIIGVQFHPEKSQAYGLATLRRFLEWFP